MKKVLSCVLALVLALAMTACGEKEQGFALPKVDSFSVGYARADVTPENGTPMGGYGNSLDKLSTMVNDPLYMICLAMSDGEDTVLLYAMDLENTPDSLIEEARAEIQSATGVPQEQIIMCVIHTHSAPDMAVADENEQAAKAYAQWKNAAVETAKEALLDMAPATIQGGKTETQGLAFVRHYLMNDGTYAGDNFGNWSSMIKDYAQPGDNELVVTKFFRSEKKDIMMLNFQVHPCFTGSNDATIISADCVGATRDYVAEKTGAEVIYFTGAAGNQNYKTRIVKDMTNDTMEVWAQKLGDYAINTQLQDISGEDIIFHHEVYTGDVWKETDPVVLEKAQKVYDYFLETDRETATPMAQENGFSSVYVAREILNHTKMSDTQTMEMTAFSVGDWAAVGAAYEMFSVQGTHIKGNSPFAVTSILGYAGPRRSYIPSQEAYDYGCYESQTAIFAGGTAEILADKYVEMLKGLKQ